MNFLGNAVMGIAATVGGLVGVMLVIVGVQHAGPWSVFIVLIPVAIFRYIRGPKQTGEEVEEIELPVVDVSSIPRPDPELWQRPLSLPPRPIYAPPTDDEDEDLPSSTNRRPPVTPSIFTAP